MKVKYQCRKCKKENEFETVKAKAEKLLIEQVSLRSEPVVYIVNCSHCGAKNRVEV